MTVKATFVAAPSEAERIADLLERHYGEAGIAVSVEEKEPGTQMGQRPVEWMTSAYFEDGDTDAITAELRDRLGSDAFGALASVEVLPETNWVELGLASLTPVAAGRFVVHGSHARAAVPAGRIAIEIEAGIAFGTGHHATTAGCLAVLDRLIRTRRYKNPLDLGTGSGVLAIALAKTLRRPVLASDIDADSVRVAKENAAANGVGNLVRCVTASGVRHAAIRESAPYDLIVANILAEPLCRLAPQVAPLVAKGGTLVLSGLLPWQRERVVAAYRTQGLSLSRAVVRDGWSVLVFDRH